MMRRELSPAQKRRYVQAAIVASFITVLGVYFVSRAPWWVWPIVWLVAFAGAEVAGLERQALEKIVEPNEKK